MVVLKKWINSCYTDNYRTYDDSSYKQKDDTPAVFHVKQELTQQYPDSQGQKHIDAYQCTKPDQNTNKQDPDILTCP